MKRTILIDDLIK